MIHPFAYYYLAKDGNSSITGSEVWWTMTPSEFLVNTANSQLMEAFFVRGEGKYPGRLVQWLVSAHGAIRPVVSLKAEVVVTSGDGSANNPYTVALP